jgi:CheY-like chemotaxis protein
MATPSTQPGIAIAQSCSMKHILIADDNIGVVALVARSLPGYQVTTAHNGVEALVLAKTMPQCDLLITDYLMPVLNGEQVATRLRVDRPSVKTLLMTGFGPLVNMDATATDAQLAKPFQPAALRLAVANLIGRAES